MLIACGRPPLGAAVDQRSAVAIVPQFFRPVDKDPSVIWPRVMFSAGARHAGSCPRLVSICKPNSLKVVARVCRAVNATIHPDKTIFASGRPGLDPRRGEFHPSLRSSTAPPTGGRPRECRRLCRPLERFSGSSRIETNRASSCCAPARVESCVSAMTDVLASDKFVYLY
jgi:hypothetical protein